jgi:hypothetical protein
MCTALLPPGVNPVAVKYISYHIYIADNWVLHHDNAPAQPAPSIREFLAKKNIPVLPHPPYSPDVAPCDFYLFTKLKLKLKGHYSRTIVNIQKNCNR